MESSPVAIWLSGRLGMSASKHTAKKFRRLLRLREKLSLEMSAYFLAFPNRPRSIAMPID